MTTDSVLSASNLDLLPSSLVVEGNMEYAMVRSPSGRKVAVLCPSGYGQGLEGEQSELDGKQLFLCPLSPGNAVYLRAHLPWLTPGLLDLKTSAGMGDRVGLATEGHVRAVRSCEGHIAPIFAQQSIREMARTDRTPQQVMDDAVWGVFAGGWRDGFGADADHLKTTADIDICLNTGYTFFTIDPGEYVDNRAESADLSTLREIASALPQAIQPANSGLLGKLFDFEGLQVVFDEQTVLKAAVKYGKAVAHVAAMYEHLSSAASARPFELEVSVDETEQPTSHAEHVYVAYELKRLGVKWVSLAPRFVGRFEKGVDYIGDVAAFEADIAGHAAIARALGPYKLSLHSGSDKFSIYPAAVRQTRGLVHLKTAGTSYLEALRTIGAVEPDFLRLVYVFSRGRFEIDKQTYHISASLDRAPDPAAVSDWTSLLDQFDAREILHVVFGSVLTSPELHPRFVELLEANLEPYAANLEKHFKRHLASFVLKD